MGFNAVTRRRGNGAAGGIAWGRTAPPLQEEDAALAEDDVDRLEQMKKLLRTRGGEAATAEVPWLRRTEYIANVILNPDSKTDAYAEGVGARAGVGGWVWASDSGGTLNIARRPLAEEGSAFT